MEPQEERARRRILGALAVPSKLFLPMRPLVWAGAGLAGAAGIAAVAILIAATMTNDARPPAPVSAPSAEATPFPSTGDPCEPALVAPGDGPLEPKLLVINDGGIGYLRLEWVGGPEGTTSWQYRQREWQGSTPPPWGDWTAIPDSDASTCSYRVPLSPGGAYEFEVRTVGTLTAVSVNARVDPYEPDRRRPNFGVANEASGLQWVSQYGVTEGDGTTPWQLGDFTITIPDGVRVYADGWWGADCFAEPEVEACHTEGVQLFDYETGAVLALTVEGEEIERWFPEDGDTETVSALFDQITASIRPLD